jgi:hypothetical protein
MSKDKKDKRSINLGVNGVDSNRSSNAGSHGGRGLRDEAGVVIESSCGDERRRKLVGLFFFLLWRIV